MHHNVHDNVQDMQPSADWIPAVQNTEQDVAERSHTGAQDGTHPESVDVILRSQPEVVPLPVVAASSRPAGSHSVSHLHVLRRPRLNDIVRNRRKRCVR